MKKTLKLLSMLLAFAMLVSMVGCGDAENPTEQQSEAPVIEGDEFNNAAVGTEGAVSSFSEITSQVGVDILKAGGNAVDAAVATILAVGVCEPHHSGLGGSGIMNIYLADEDRYTVIEYLETIPSNVDNTYYNKAQYVKHARAAGVPGQVAGLAYAIEKYGTMEFKDVVAPAVKLAREGFVLDNVAAGAMADAYQAFSAEGYEYLYDTFTNDGFPYSEGETFTNPDLANTLQTICDEGWQSFYTGSIAEKIVAGMKEVGAAISMEDLANYRPREYEPIETSYYDYNIVTVPNPSVGGTLLIGAMNIMEQLDIKQYEVGSVEYWKLFNEAVRLSNVDAYSYSGDPEFYEMPSDTLISKAHAQERAKLYSTDRTLFPVPESNLEYKKLTDAERTSKAAANETVLDEGGCTTHIACVDPSGNVVSSTNTVGYSWGCYYATPGLGFVYNNHLNNVSWTNENSPDYFADKGKMVRSTMTPTIVEKDGKPILAVGSPGSTVIPPVIMSVINNTLLYNMNIQQAINAPRAFAIDRDSSNGPLTDLTAETGRLGAALKRQLEVYGYSFIDCNDYAQVCGGIAAIYIDRENNKLIGGGDPRRSYKAVAY